MPIPASWSPQLLSLLRIVAGLGFMAHGVSKFFGFRPSRCRSTRLLTSRARSSWSAAR